MKYFLNALSFIDFFLYSVVHSTVPGTGIVQYSTFRLWFHFSSTNCAYCYPLLCKQLQGVGIWNREKIKNHTFSWRCLLSGVAFLLKFIVYFRCYNIKCSVGQLFDARSYVFLKICEYLLHVIFIIKIFNSTVIMAEQPTIISEWGRCYDSNHEQGTKCLLSCTS